MANRKATFAKRQRETDLKDRAKQKDDRRNQKRGEVRENKGPQIAWDEAVHAVTSDELPALGTANQAREPDDGTDDAVAAPAGDAAGAVSAEGKPEPGTPEVKPASGASGAKPAPGTAEAKPASGTPEGKPAPRADVKPGPRTPEVKAARPAAGSAAKPSPSTPTSISSAASPSSPSPSPAAPRRVG